MAFTASENERREITKSKWTNAKSSGHHFSSKVRKQQAMQCWVKASTMTIKCKGSAYSFRGHLE